jgi:sirohydrochlorin cobaltochelatase
MTNTHSILLAHGSRDKRWCDNLESGLESIENLLDHQSSLAYMEMAEPSLEQVIEGQYENGMRNFDIIPLFFSAGRHLLFDVPKQLEVLRLKLENVTIKLHPPLGEEPEFWAFLGAAINKKLN